MDFRVFQNRFVLKRIAMGESWYKIALEFAGLRERKQSKSGDFKL